MTAARDMDFYMANPDDFAGLSEEDKARLYAGEALQGDTDATAQAASTENSEPPAAVSTTTPEATADGSAAETEPVILTKDGKHAIPFDELAKAREQAAHWEQVAKDAAAEAERLKQQAATPAAAANPDPAPASDAPQAVDIDALEAQHFEATLEGDKETAMALRKQINAEIERRAVERVSANTEAATAETQAFKAFNDTVAKAITDYPFLDSNSPDKNNQAINDVREWRDYRISQGDAPADALAKAVAKFGPIYEGAKPTPQTAAQGEPTAADKAAAVIAKAKTSVPASMSDIPAGTAAHHDEAGALMQMGSNDLMAKFAGKTPEQIEALMAKVI